MTKHQKVWAALLTLLCIALLSTPPVACQESGSAQSAINSAKNTLQTCLQSVIAAESAGADVTSLMVTLNQAADLLSQAELAYAAQNYDSAYNYASQSRSKLNGFANQAAPLEQAAIEKEIQTSQNNTQTLLIALIVFVSGVSAWFILYRRERRRMHGAPAV